MKTPLLVITGGSSGIGKATAALFGQHHWRVINISRHRCDLPNVDNIALDLSKKHWPKTLTEKLTQASQHAPKVCFIHNACHYQKDTLLNADAESLRTIFETNLIAPVRLNQCIIPHMPSGSSIIYVGSTLSDIGTANAMSYIVSKHGSAGLMRATLHDVAKLTSRIHTCCVCPGFTDTPMLYSHLVSTDRVNQAREMTAAKRLLDPEEIANTLYFCAQNPAINGAVIHANLGQL